MEMKEKDESYKQRPILYTQQDTGYILRVSQLPDAVKILSAL
jgi:hypothetical protein